MLSVETQLRERIETLEGEVAYWKGEARAQIDADRQARLQKAFKLTPALAWILETLLTLDGKILIKQRLADELPGWDVSDRNEQVIHVQLCRLRKALGHDAIETARGLGWRLTENGKDTVILELNNST